VRLILFVQLVFGILIVIRTIDIFRARALLSASATVKVGIIFVCALAWNAFFCAKDLVLSFFFTLALLGTLAGALFFCERRKIDTLKAEIPVFLDRWILNLRLGSAVSTARDAALREHSENFQTLLRPLFATGVQARRTHLLLHGALVAELERAHLEPHSALARLENLRAMLRKQSEFRRKSGQAAHQTAIQAGVMLLLLVALTLFTLQRYGWRRCSDLILASVGLSLAGLICMIFLARKTKWKI
jgi:hypothetical protein